MSEQISIGWLESRLHDLSGAANRTPIDSQKNQDLAVDKFIDFFEEIPDTVEIHPEALHREFALNLVKVGMANNHLASMGRISLATGRVLSRLNLKYRDIVEPAMDYLKWAVRNNDTWEPEYDPMAQISRNDALEIYFSALIGTPEFGTPEWARIVVEAAIKPLFTDECLVENMSFFKSSPNAYPDKKTAALRTRRAREALQMMIFLNPSLAKDAREALTNVGKMVFNRSHEDMRPIVAYAVEQLHHTISKAFDKATLPERSAVRQNIGCGFQNVLGL